MIEDEARYLKEAREMTTRLQNKEKGIYENTVIIYTSDHGCHFKTRNFEYKRSCHESSIHTPLVFGGGAIEKTDNIDSLVSLIDLPPTILNLAGITVPESYSGNVLPILI